MGFTGCNWLKNDNGMGYATYSPLVQESAAEFHKMLFGLFGIEVLK